MLLLGYSEGLESERAMAWRAADSLSLRQFLDIALHEAPPDHLTVSRTWRRIDVETHEAVFTWVLQRVADAGCAHGPGRARSTARERSDREGPESDVLTWGSLFTWPRGSLFTCHFHSLLVAGFPKLPSSRPHQ